MDEANQPGGRRWLVILSKCEPPHTLDLITEIFYVLSISGIKTCSGRPVPQLKRIRHGRHSPDLG